MLDRFRLPLLVVSGALMLWGASLFWHGKIAADAERKNRKPQPVTRDSLLTNPPTKGVTWVTLTDGNAVLTRSHLMDFGRPGVANAPFYLYVPVLSAKEAAASFTTEAISANRNKYSVMLRTNDKKRKSLFQAMSALTKGSRRTADTWLAQNRAALQLKPPFTGLLVRRALDPADKMLPAKSGFAPDGYVLWEGATPPVVAPEPVALGLAILMGVPTLWVFALLLTGKFDPPDDATPSITAPAGTPSDTVDDAAQGRVNIPAPSGSVMPSAPDS